MALRVQEFRNDAGEVSFVDYNLREKLALSEIDRWSEVFRFISRGQPLALLANSGRCWKAWEYRRWVEEGYLVRLQIHSKRQNGSRYWLAEGFFAPTQGSLDQRAERPKNYGQKIEINGLAGHPQASAFLRRVNAISVST
jgi:hypothetical protein